MTHRGVDHCASSFEASSSPATSSSREIEKNDPSPLAEVRLHYRTLGTPVRDASGVVRNAVLILHGTGGSGAQFLQPQFGD